MTPEGRQRHYPGGEQNLAVHPVVQDEKGQAEHGERVLRPQVAVAHIDIELFGEPATATAVSSPLAGSIYAR